MNIRKIPIRIENEYVKGAGVVIGASGSHDDVALKIHYGEMWEGLSKSIVWKDATRGNAVTTLLASNMLDDEGDYIVPVPNEPKAYPGEIFVSFKGYQVSGGVETAAVLTAVARFTVLESEWDEDAEASQAITPSAAEQLQANKQDKLTWDNTPTSGSSNPVTSDGIYRSLTESAVMMKKLDYDSTGTGNKVDTALNAEKLGNQTSAYYAAQSEVTQNTNARHTHGNKALLDTYDQSNADIASAVSNSHTHENKALLDSYSQTESSLADAVDKKHSHGNKDLLDAYTQTESNLANAVGKAHEHANKVLLDTYTQTDYDIADAITKTHEHSNMSALNTIPSGGVVTVLGNDDTTIPTSKAVADAIGEAGGGDMLKSSYDTTSTGNKVDTALNAEKLNNQLPAYYATQSEVTLNSNARHSHDNKALLDTYTQSEADLADAVSKKHEHSNKTVLDGISAADISNWNDKQNALTFDDVPTSGSNNPVKSGGIASSVVRGDIAQTAQTDGWRKQAQDNIGVSDLVSPLINQWDEQTRLGYYSSSGEYMVASNQLCSANLCKCEGGKSYFFNFAVTGAAGITNICWYDANKAFISRVQATGTGVYTAPNNAKYFAISIGATYGTTYNHDISINYPSTYTGYYPSALPKANAERENEEAMLMMDGYISPVIDGIGNYRSGNVYHKRIGRVDLGSLTWTRSNYGSIYAFIAPLPLSKLYSLATNYPCVFESQKYNRSDSLTVVAMNNNEWVMAGYTSTYGGLFFRDDSFTDANAFKASVSGQYIYYELASEVTRNIDGNEKFGFGNLAELSYTVVSTW